MSTTPAGTGSVIVGQCELVTAGEIAARLGVSVERVRQWRVRSADAHKWSRPQLPEPMGELAVSGQPLYLWSWAQVRRWAVRTGRLEP